MKNCFDGYLTKECANCPDWADGTDERGFGCATRYPIMWCPAVKRMFEAKEKKRKENENKNG